MNPEAEIETLISKLYSAICFLPGGKPDFDLLRTLFIPGAKMISNNADQPVIMEVEGYVERMTNGINSGRLVSFQESEVASTTEVFGKIAHRFSTYTSRFLPEDEKPFDVGINSIQMMEVDGKWLISSLLWNNVNDARPLPEKYLP